VPIPDILTGHSSPRTPTVATQPERINPTRRVSPSQAPIETRRLNGGSLAGTAAAGLCRFPRVEMGDRGSDRLRVSLGAVMTCGRAAPGPDVEAPPAAPIPDAKRAGALETEYQPLRVFAWAAVVGIAVGIVGATFRLLVLDAGERRLALLGWVGARGGLVVSVASTALLLAAALALVRRVAPEASGSGVQEVEGALDGVRPLRWRRVIPVKFAGGLLALGGGMVLGREGPTIQIGGNLGEMIGESFRLPMAVRRTLVAAGAGAGLAAAFNAPLAGVLFVLEEMRPQFKYTFTSVQSVLIACGVADVAVRALAGQGPVIPIATFPSPPLAALWLFPIFGAVFGVLGLVFGRVLVRTLDGFAALRGAPAGLVVGGMIGLLAWVWPDATGSGDELIRPLLASTAAGSALLALLAVRFATTVVSYGCGAPGGIFAPMLALGTIFGTWYGRIVHASFPALGVDAGAFAVAGMGALFTATVRAPITGIALAIEITANYEQILPLLLTCSAATIVAELLGSGPIYTVLLQRTLRREGRRAEVT
jgi:CIC family chloride channel protein